MHQDSNRPTAPASSPAKTAADRRRHQRLAEDRPGCLQRGSNATNVEMVDISAGGACFLSPRPLSMGRPVRLQVGHGAQQITLDGTVVRQVERPDGQHEIGLRVDDHRGFDMSRRFPSRSARLIQR